MADKKNILLLFQHPNEPVFTRKNNGTAVFDVPEEYLTDRYKPIGQELQNRFNQNVDERIPLPQISPPDIGFATEFPKTAPFSLFNWKNKEIAGRLIKLFMDADGVQNFLALAAYVKDRVNPYLYQYSLAVATAHRPDTKDLTLPSIVTMFPSQFVDPSVFPKAREELSLVSEGQRMAIEIPRVYTASEKETEQNMAYFREDIGVNMHHWHWHLVYPGNGANEIVNKDRRGELFFYMHNQIIARYNVDRFANNLPKTRPLSNFREPIIEAYFPKIIRSSNNRAYPPRVSNTVLNDVNRESDNAVFLVSDLERWRDRIFDAIDRGFVVAANGDNIPLNNTRGIDVLGNLVEASSLSANFQLYGSLHNSGHDAIAYSHDPEARYLEDYGVMGDVATAMRDPIFYRWHTFIDNLFLRHKNLQPSYNPATELAFDGVSVDAISVNSNQRNVPPNFLITHWQRSDVDLKAGLDFGEQGNVYASFTHLQNAPFHYNISVTNNSGAQRRGTCRIFLGPKVDERNNTINFVNQRNLMIEMDRFLVTLEPGQNTILRNSDESSVTLPYERSFRQIGSQNKPRGAADLAQFQFCGCGWPQHMLLPKGSPAGTNYDVFVMVSNYDDDTVNEVKNPAVACNDAESFCGLKDQLYPDRRSMGFPFDRRSAAGSLAEFANATTNMAVATCTIRFVDRYVDRT